MPAEVDTMMSVQEIPWHGLGTIVQDAPNAEEALRLAGLDWTVVSRPVFTMDNDDQFEDLPGYRANYRSDRPDGFLGLVSDRYRIVQNVAAFDWVDELMGQGMQFETAGALKDGQRVWITAKLPDEYKVLDDPITTYLTFTNGHDGRHAVQVIVSPVRVVCQNTLSYALRQAPRAWSAIHATNIERRMDEARRVLQLTEGYMKAMDRWAEGMSAKTITAGEWHEMVEVLIPSERPTQQIQGLRQALEAAMYFPDLSQFSMTGWGAANAVSWLTSHRQHPRNPEMAMATFIDGDPMHRRLMDLLDSPAPEDELELVEV